MLKSNLKMLVFLLAVFFVVLVFFNFGEIGEVLSYFSISPTQEADVSIGACTSGAIFTDYCTAPLSPVLSWTVTEGTQTAYAIQVDNDGAGACASSFPSPEVDTGQIGSSSTSYTVPGGSLNYNTTYYWQVAVMGGSSAWTGWIPHEVSFTTTLHQWPSVNFSWSPSSPRVESEVQFFDESTVYGGATKATFSWTFQDGSPATSSEQNPIVFFTSEGDKIVTFSVTDSDGYICSQSQTVSVGGGIIDFDEIIPK